MNLRGYDGQLLCLATGLSVCNVASPLFDAAVVAKSLPVTPHTPLAYTEYPLLASAPSLKKPDVAVNGKK